MSKPDPKAYLDKELGGAEMKDEIKSQGREPDCYMVFKSRNHSIVGGPIAVYGTKAGLYKHFPELVEEIDEKWGIEMASWWFDD